MISILAGDSLVLKLTVKDEIGTIIDLTGSSFLFGISQKPFTPILIEKSYGLTLTDLPSSVSYTEDSDINVSDPLNGIVEFTLTSTDTKDLLGNYYLEVKMIDSLNNRSTIYKDYITILNSIIK